MKHPKVGILYQTKPCVWIRDTASHGWSACSPKKSHVLGYDKPIHPLTHLKQESNMWGWRRRQAHVFWRWQSSSFMPFDCMDTRLLKLIYHKLLSLSAMRVFKFNWTPSFGVVFHVYLLQMFFLVCVCPVFWYWAVLILCQVSPAQEDASTYHLCLRTQWALHGLAGYISYRTSFLHQGNRFFLMGWKGHIEWDFWYRRLLLLADRMSLNYIYVRFSLSDFRSINEDEPTLAQIR